MALPRFLVRDLARSSDLVELTAEEAHHAAKVMRLGVGEAVELFDGQGNQCTAHIARVGRDGVACRRGDITRATTEPQSRMTVVQAALAGGGLDGVVRDATMLGAIRIEIVCAERSQISPTSIVRRGLEARWSRIALASAKQCGRSVIPDIQVWASFEAAVGADRSGVRVILAEPGLPAADPWQPSPRTPAASHEAHLLVGPEGGWTVEELRLACDAGWRPWRLGPRTLRADAAAAVALSILSYAWEPGEAC